MAEEDVIKPRNFHEMELDDRILKAVAKLGWLEPTLIQERAIPLLLEGKDVLLRARTGSGKTGAFAIPVVQRILNSKQVSKEQNTKALILAPSKELCQQIHTNFMELTTKCSREICCVDISPQVDVSAQRQILVERPDIVVGTPLRALTHLKARNLNLKDSLEVLVVDEADLVFSFGYESEMKEVLSYLPRVYQAILASATLSEDVLNLKSMVLHNPVILKLQEPELAPATQLTHYHLAAEEDEKAAILYALLKLHLVRGKSIIFVNSVDRCYKLKLFLEQFGIPTCVLNSELPATIRCLSVNQFNQGVYDIIIASDEKALDEPHALRYVGKKGKRKKDKEFGVARGIDFQFVSNIINFDFPPDVGSYIHRVGRTARGKHQGTALSFVSIRERPLMEDVEDRLRSCCSEDEKVFRAYQFKLEEVEGFRYRSKDAWRSVTRIAVREARLKEIKQEVLNCQKLKSYFVDNPRDLQSLRHDKALHTVKIQPHLADVPEYIIPPALKNLAGVSRPHKRHFPRDGGFSGTSNAKARYDAKKRNPLLCMEFSGFKKKR
ncbi:probable ATP-dependent RNA helicase DDX56 isoform X1 [Zootermopsis nevadensis]|uniref:RNA helicase n=1 Tax=Zootermopsis nevadensis TaxID=136037 RepID=A0A067RE39_ZOONE|nr:probable ATP-dependent RNA helicase DDX56 isoform X1 [Zootermopsis nevadensis]KDR21293.1 putative ATP-dependent RNA helicase DDX56 [Zootermopsis nevadensis]